MKSFLKLETPLPEKDNFKLENYLHLSAGEIRKLEPGLRHKIMVASAEIAAQDYELIEDYDDIIEY